MECVSLFKYGTLGAHSNLLMEASTWNLKQWLLAILALFPAEKVTNVSDYLMEIESIARQSFYRRVLKVTGII